MSWILIAIVAYFFLALVNIGDKLFLGNFIPNYKVYTILIGIFGLAVFLIAPWFLTWPGLFVFIISLVSGAFFILALLLFFHSLQIGEASRVIPFVGGLVPIFSLIFSVVFLGQALLERQWLAFGLLLLGSVLIVRLPHKTHWWHKLTIIKNLTGRHNLEIFEELFITVFAAVFFAASFVSSKYVFDQTEFLNGFIWVRLGSFLVVVFLLLKQETRKALKKAIKKIKSKTGVLFLGNQGFGAIGFFLQSLAISLGSVALVNAMQGVQFVFVIALAGLASIKFPKLSGEEKIDKKIITEKILAVLVIGIGLWVLST
jgi:drug/metabolite transporter (DMT)-like permease